MNNKANNSRPMDTVLDEHSTTPREYLVAIRRYLSKVQEEKNSNIWLYSYVQDVHYLKQFH